MTHFALISSWQDDLDNYADWQDDAKGWRETPEEEYDRIARWRNRPTNPDLYVCTDLFEGYDPSEDLPF